MLCYVIFYMIYKIRRELDTALGLETRLFSPQRENLCARLTWKHRVVTNFPTLQIAHYGAAQCHIRCRLPYYHFRYRLPVLTKQLLPSDLAKMLIVCAGNFFFFFQILFSEVSHLFPSHSKLQYQLKIFTSLASQIRRAYTHAETTAPPPAPLIRVTDRRTTVR